MVIPLLSVAYVHTQARAPAASFNHGTSFHRRWTSISGYWPTALEHFTVGGDVGAVARDLPQATEDLLVRAVIPGHTPALTLFYCFIALLHLFTV